MKNLTLQQIFKEANYTVNFDNRSYFCKSVNNILNNLNCILIIAPKGKQYVHNKTKKVWTIKVQGYGKAMILNADVNPRNVLKIFADFLKVESVKQIIKSNIKTPSNCTKCNGKGKIESFSHVCEGVCFDCGGIGSVGSISVDLNIK